MLSRADNERLTRVGPDTPMGALMRRFWIPALLESEVAEPDGPPVRLRLLGEDLVAFRDTRGRIGIIDAYCAHRRAHLFFGRNEECGLRCVYHGWKFDVDGKCIDQPSAGAGRAINESLSIKAYPTTLRGGAIWVYMGPRNAMPQPPDFEWARLPAARRYATKRLQSCNWAQAVEGGIDSSHVSFLHGNSAAQMKAKGGGFIPNAYLADDRNPAFEVKETPAGLLIGARRTATPGSYYWRVTQFLAPFYTMIPPVGAFEDSRAQPFDGHAWVPIDDEHTWTWSFGTNPHRDYTAEELQRMGGADGFWGPIDANFMPLKHRGNDYELDRQMQRHGNYTGIMGIPNQDAAVQESMGPIVDRSLERLAPTDRAIVLFRRLMLRLAAALESGTAPAPALHPDWYNVRPAALVLDSGTPFDEGAAALLSGAPVAAAGG